MLDPELIWKITFWVREIVWPSSCTLDALVIDTGEVQFSCVSSEPTSAAKCTGGMTIEYLAIPADV